ncbi:hypothetical protein ACFW16_23865 [Inquilinus sp. NPDC058860]|uniref:hypothetical protein n=1 Tax=Inquilinus sp. NPDC058860 TaxID=3346652 RepID=UPI00369069A3
MISIINGILIIIKNEWKGVASGLLLGIGGNYVYQHMQSYFDGREYRDAALRELSARIHMTHQGMVFTSTLSPKLAYQNLQKLYDDTKDETGDSRFSGKRFENIVFDLRRVGIDATTSDLIDRIKHLRGDIPHLLDEWEDDKDDPKIRTVVQELQDYYYCFCREFSEGIGGECNPPMNYYSGLHYCIRFGDVVSLPPEGFKAIRTYSAGEVNG